MSETAGPERAGQGEERRVGPRTWLVWGPIARRSAAAAAVLGVLSVPSAHLIEAMFVPRDGADPSSGPSFVSFVYGSCLAAGADSTAVAANEALPGEVRQAAQAVASEQGELCREARVTAGRLRVGLPAEAASASPVFSSSDSADVAAAGEIYRRVTEANLRRLGSATSQIFHRRIGPSPVLHLAEKADDAVREQLPRFTGGASVLFRSPLEPGRLAAPAQRFRGGWTAASSGRHVAAAGAGI